MFNPFDWLNKLFGMFVDSWTLSGSQAIQNAIQLLQQAPWPNLGADWYKTVWNTSFGFSLLIGMLAIGLHALVFAFRPNSASMGAALGNFGRLILNGIFQLVVIVLAIQIVNLLIDTIVLIIKTFTHEDIWYTALLIIKDANITDIWASLGVSWWALQLGHLLTVQAFLNQNMLYIYAVWYLFGHLFGPGRFGQVVRSIFSAAILTALLGRAVQILWLGVGATGAHFTQILPGFPGWVNGVGTLFIGYSAALIPAGMWVLFFVISLRVERRVDIAEIIRRQQESRAAIGSRELAARRASPVASMSDGIKDATTAAVKAVAIAAIGLGVAKATSAALAKVATMAPEAGASKLAAAAGWAIMGASAAGERKLKNYVHNRIGQPGASRAANARR